MNRKSTHECYRCWSPFTLKVNIHDRYLTSASAYVSGWVSYIWQGATMFLIKERYVARTLFVVEKCTSLNSSMWCTRCLVFQYKFWVETVCFMRLVIQIDESHRNSNEADRKWSIPDNETVICALCNFPKRVHSSLNRSQRFYRFLSEVWIVLI